MCNRIASIFALSERYSWSFPQRESIRGKSWLFQNREFQPSCPSSVCHFARIRFSSATFIGCRSHFSPFDFWSRPICSNWKTIDSSLRSGAEYSLAISGVAPQVSPTVSRSWLPKVACCISCRNSCSCGPLPVMPFSGIFPIRSMTSMRKPPMPLAIQRFIIA